MPNTKDLRDLDSQIKRKTISAASFKKSSSVDISKDITNIHKTISNLAGIVRKSIIRVSNLQKIVQNNSKKITSLKNISKIQSGRISGTNIGAKLPGSPEDNLNKNISIIAESVTSIAEILKKQSELQKKSEEKSRKEKETSKRASAESRLEKGFSVAIKVAEKVLAPVKSLLSRIIDFFMAIFWGKVFLKLLDWFADPNNKKKINSLFRFFNDHWPKLLALYLRFGTGLGRFVGGLTRVVFFGTRKLLQTVAQLVGAKAAARFLGGRGGKLVAAGLQVATTVGTTMALSGGIEKFAGGGESEKTPKLPNYFGGGLVNMFRGLKGFFGGGPGRVSGQKGVDKIPAMLSDGEFVMSRGAVQKYGVGTLEAMNSAGGGTNKPRMISGVGYAKGGGLFGSDPGSSNPFMGLLRVGPSISGLLNLIGFGKSATSNKQNSKPKPFDSRAYTSALTGSASKLLKQKWSYASQGGDPSVGCAPAINEVYRKAGLPIPWKNVARINYVPDIYASLNKTFVRIPENKRTPGDIVIWKDTGYPAGSGKDPYGHIGIVMPDGKIANNSSSRGTFTNLNTPSDAKSWWPNTRELIYFRHPKVNSLLIASSSRPSTKPGAPTSTASSRPQSFASRVMATVSAPFSKFANGGMAGGTPATISKNPVKARNISPPSRPPVVVRALDTSGAQNMSVPRAGGSPQVPSFSVSFNENRERVLAMHGIA